MRSIQCLKKINQHTVICFEGFHDVVSQQQGQNKQDRTSELASLLLCWVFGEQIQGRLL